MIDLDANPGLRRLYHIARFRVTLGFAVAALAFWLARPTWATLGSGAALAAFGEGLRLWAAGYLEKGDEVTCSGPYRLNRHPLYCGTFVIGVGFSVAAASAVVATLVLVYLAIMLPVAIRLEEATLRAAFGEEYERYVRGSLTVPERRFSAARVLGNGEHHALLGFAAALVILGLKVSLGV